ncbi:HWE histidine kinase domain-containing protein [Sphingomonas sp. MMS24-JH45]
MALAAGRAAPAFAGRGHPATRLERVRDGRRNWASPDWTAYTGQSEGAEAWLGVARCAPPGGSRDRAPRRGATRRDPEGSMRNIASGDRPTTSIGFRPATPVRDPTGAIIEWIGTSTDVDDLRQLQERQGVMVKELQHRTRNLITVVSAISRQTLRNALLLPDFRERFWATGSPLRRGSRACSSHLLRREAGHLRSVAPVRARGAGRACGQADARRPG